MMTRLKGRIGIVIFGLLFSLGCARSAFDVPKPKVVVLNNGMTVFILEDHSLPTFRLFSYQPAGAVFEGPEEAGLAPITAEVLRTGGTAKHRPDEIDRILSDLSASIEMTSDDESAMIALRCLTEDRKTLLDLLTEMLREPGFDGRAFALAQRQAEVALQQSLEKPADLAALYFPSQIYGATSPWGQVPSLESLSRLQVEQARRFYQHFYYPSRMFVAVAGDFDTKTLVGELQKSLGSWQREEPGAIQWPPIEAQAPAAQYYVMPSKQVAVRTGHLGTSRDDPDKYALIVANFILGGSGSMTSRLGSQIRADEGQAYSIWSQYGFSRVPGIFTMVAETEASQMEDVVQSMRTILKKYREEGPTAQELADAKKAILSSLLFDYESRYAIAKDWARFAFWGYPADYLKIFTRGIKKVDMEAIHRVLKERFHPEQLSYLVVGPRWLWQQAAPNWPALKLVEEKDEGKSGD